MIFRIERYEVSKDSSPTEFPIMRMIKPLFKDGVGIDMSDLVARYKNISCLPRHKRELMSVPRPASGAGTFSCLPAGEAYPGW
jgi:hypothetical protein